MIIIFSKNIFSSCPQKRTVHSREMFSFSGTLRYVTKVGIRSKSKEGCESTRWSTPAAKGRLLGEPSPAASPGRSENNFHITRK